MTSNSPLTDMYVNPFPSTDSNKVRYYVYIFVNDSLYEWFHSLRRVSVLRHFRPFRELELMAILFNAFTLSVRWDNSDGIKAAVALSIVFHVWFIVKVCSVSISNTYTDTHMHLMHNMYTPHRHTCTPHRHTCTPHRHTCTPHRHTCTPHRHTCTPHRHNMYTPHRHTCTPHRHTCTPHMHTCTPHMRTPHLVLT